MAGWYALILFCLAFTVPATSTGNEWNGIAFSIALLAIGAYRLARFQIRPSRLFVYGVGAAILFMLRLGGGVMSRFSDSETALVVQWIAFALVLGWMCWCAAHLYSAGQPQKDDAKDATTSGGSESVEPLFLQAKDRLHPTIVLLWIGCITMSFILRVIPYALQRSQWPLGEQDLWVNALFSSVRMGTGLLGVLLFASRNLRGSVFPTQPGEYLLLVTGIWSALSLLHRAISLSLPQPGKSAYTLFGQAGGAIGDGAQFVITLLLLVAIHRVDRRWKWFFASYISLELIHIYGWNLITSNYLKTMNSNITSAVVASAQSAILAWVVWKDWNDNIEYTWTHWLGVGLLFWEALSTWHWLIATL